MVRKRTERVSFWKLLRKSALPSALIASQYDFHPSGSMGGKAEPAPPVCLSRHSSEWQTISAQITNSGLSPEG
jgi:hypothetical protein